MRLIDGDELYQKVVGYNGGAVDKTVAKRLIDQMPTVDAVSRQAAIDALAKFVPYAICDESTESYTNELTDAYNLICQLPSAQPEIIHCRDCKWKNRHNCTRAVEVWIDDDKFCAWGERRTDETD